MSPTVVPTKNQVPAIALDSFLTKLYVVHCKSGEMPLVAVRLLLAVDAYSGEILEAGFADGAFQSIGSAAFYEAVMAYKPDVIFRDHASGTRGDPLAMFEDCGQPLTRPIPGYVVKSIERHGRCITDSLPYAVMETPWGKAPDISGLPIISMAEARHKLGRTIAWMRRAGKGSRKKGVLLELAGAEMQKQIKHHLKGPYQRSALEHLNNIHSIAREFCGGGK